MRAQTHPLAKVLLIAFYEHFRPTMLHREYRRCSSTKLDRLQEIENDSMQGAQLNQQKVSFSVMLASGENKKSPDVSTRTFQLNDQFIIQK